MAWHELPLNVLKNLLPRRWPPGDSDHQDDPELSPASFTPSSISPLIVLRPSSWRRNMGFTDPSPATTASPVDNVPPEILGYILALSIQSSVHTAEIFYNEKRYSFNMEIPWFQAQVSQYWRSCALSSSALWRKVPTISLDSGYTKTKGYLNFLGEVLRRSQRQSIMVEITSHSELGFFARWRHPVLALIMLHSPRWQIAKIYAHPSIFPLLHKITGRLQLLEAVHVSTPTVAGVTDFNTPQMDYLLSAPLLSRVYFYSPTQEFSLPFTQITHYSHHNGNPIQLTKFISKSPALLTSLDIRGCDFSLDSVIPLSRVSYLRLSDIIHLHDLLGSLYLPALEELEIYSQSADFIPTLESMIEVWRNPKIIRLHIEVKEPETFVPGDLTKLLRQTPDLITLHITLPPLQDIESLEGFENRPVIVPALRTCILDPLERHIPEYSIEAIRSLALSRSSGSHANSGASNAINHRVPFHFSLSGRCRNPGHYCHQLNGWTQTSTSFTLDGFGRLLLKGVNVEESISELESMEGIRGEDILITCIRHALWNMTVNKERYEQFGVGDRPKHIVETWTPLMEDALSRSMWRLGNGPGSSFNDRKFSITYVPCT